MKIVIIGQGGHSKVIRDIIMSTNEYQIIGYLDDKYEKFSMTNGEISGPVSAIGKVIEYYEGVKFVIGVGDNKIREKLYKDINLPIEYFATLVHHSAVVSPSSKIRSGTVVMANSIINTDSDIGQHSIINSGSIIEHDNRIGDFVHVSPNVTTTGNVKIDDGVHIGAGATIIPGIHIGEWSIIGAGTTVIEDIPENCTAVGVPAKIIKRKLVYNAKYSF